jgi:hypothetical protein
MPPLRFFAGTYAVFTCTSVACQWLVEAAERGPATFAHLQVFSNLHPVRDPAPGRPAIGLRPRVVRGSSGFAAVRLFSRFFWLTARRGPGILDDLVGQDLSIFVFSRSLSRGNPAIEIRVPAVFFTAVPAVLIKAVTPRPVLPCPRPSEL